MYKWVAIYIVPCEGLEHTPEVASILGAQSWFLIPFYGKEISAPWRRDYLEIGAGATHDKPVTSSFKNYKNVPLLK